MPFIKHEHTDDCKYGDFIHYLVEAAPDVLWYNVQDVGSYSGSVYAVGEYQKKILIYENYYGSCSGCGAWGEGGEPEDEEEVLESSKLFESATEAKDYVKKIDSYDNPDIEEMIEAIDEIDKK